MLHEVALQCTQLERSMVDTEIGQKCDAVGPKVLVHFDHTGVAAVKHIAAMKPHLICDPIGVEVFAALRHQTAGRCHHFLQLLHQLRVSF